MRPIVRLVVFAGLALGVFLALGPAMNLVQDFFACLANWLLPPLISLGVLSIFLASILGEKGKQQIVSLWTGLLGALLWILGQLGRLIVAAVRLK